MRNVFVVGPDKKIKLILVYPMTTGRNFDEVLRGIEPALERELERGDVRAGVDELQRHERAVVEAALCIGRARDAGAAE